MRRALSTLVLLVLAGSVVPAWAGHPPADSGQQTYYLVSRGDSCGALSIDRRSRGRTTDGCGNPFYGLLSYASRDTSRRMTHLAIDGLPFTLDASKRIAGSVTVRSYLAVGIARRDAVGFGQPVLEITLMAMLDGQEVKIGEYVSDPYVITPVARDYIVNFHIDPDPSLSGRQVQSVKLKLRTSGSSVFHGFYPANGSTHFTLGYFPPEAETSQT